MYNKRRHSYTITTKLILVALLAFVFQITNAIKAQGDDNIFRDTRADARMKTRVSFSSCIGFYSTNKNYTVDTRQKMALCLSVKQEIQLNKQKTDFILIGLNYMWHGLTYNSYYFKPDSIQLYYGNKNYNYSLRIHEINLPIQYKMSLKRENNKISSPYLLFGYFFRYLVSAKADITQNGQAIMNDKVALKFKNAIITKRNNAFLNIGIGYQKNAKSGPTAVFAEANFLYDFSPYSFEKPYAPVNSFIYGKHLLIGIGYKF